MTGRVLFLSHTHEAGVFKVGSHHLAREFARAGYDVLHVSSPFSLVHRVRDRARDEGSRWAAARAVRVDRHGVRHAVPRTLLPARLHTLGYLRRLLHQQHFTVPRFVFVDQPLMAHPAVCALGGTTIYRPTDTYTGQAAAMQRRLVHVVDGVAATSQEVLRALAPDPRTPTTVIENGVDFPRFARPPGGARDGVVYVGSLDRRFCWATLSALADREKTLRFTVAGPLSGPVPPIPTNVRLLGAIDYGRVPDVLATHRIGLLPLTDAAENRGRSPMKLYEYLAAGLAVVARRGGGPLRRPIPGVFGYDDLDGARAALTHALARPVLAADGIAAAAAQDWPRKMRELEAFALRVEAGPGDRHRGAHRADRVAGG